MVSIVRAAALSLTSTPETLGLTLRERQIANAVCQGQTSKEIALDLGLSHRTVEVFRARILKKTGAANAAALAALLKLKG
jgi:DNA-binding NarL/FixJ family response regulator